MTYTKVKTKNNTFLLSLMNVWFYVDTYMLYGMQSSWETNVLLVSTSYRVLLDPCCSTTECLCSVAILIKRCLEKPVLAQEFTLLKLSSIELINISNIMVNRKWVYYISKQIYPKWMVSYDTALAFCPIATEWCIRWTISLCPITSGDSYHSKPVLNHSDSMDRTKVMMNTRWVFCISKSIQNEWLVMRMHSHFVLLLLNDASDGLYRCV